MRNARIFAVLLALGAAPAIPAEPLDRLLWLVGCWEGSRDGRVVEEQWMAPRAGTMLGVGRTLESGSAVSFEYLRIETAGEGLVLHVSADGRGDEAFPSGEIAEGSAVFSSPDGDFPRTILYERRANGTALARIGGTVPGRAHGADLEMRRVPCGPVAAAPEAAPETERAIPTRKAIERGRVLDGVPCRKGNVYLYDDGRLAGCRLWGDHRFGETLVPYASEIELDPEGKLRAAYLRVTFDVQGHACKGGGRRYRTRFHPNGKLALCSLERDETIDGVPCAGATFAEEVVGSGPETHFLEDGRLKSCEAARDVEIGGRSYRKGERVEISPAR